MTRTRLAPMLVLLALLALAAGACLPGRGAPVVGQRCEGVPASVCSRILDEARQDAPPGAGDVVAIDVRCAASPCTESSGEVDVSATYADGRTISWQHGWAEPAPAAPVGPGVPAGGGPTPLPIEPTCVGVGPDVCLEMGGSGLDDRVTSAEPVSILVRCTTTCDATSGDGETVVRFADGTSTTVAWQYRSGE